MFMKPKKLLLCIKGEEFTHHNGVKNTNSFE